MSNGDTAAAPAEPKEIERIHSRIDGSNQHLVHAAERLEQLSDRIQGCIPRETEKINKLAAAEVPSGALQGVHNQLDRMSGLSDRIHSAIARLEEVG